MKAVIPADAAVRKIAGIVGGGGAVFEVVVTSPWKPGFFRRYFIEATSDNMAAAEGLRRFEEEHSGAPKLLVN